MLKWRVGDVTITRVVELEGSGEPGFVFGDAVTPELIREIGWLRPNFAEEDGRLKSSVHALVVETPRRRIVVDTCIGNDKRRDLPIWNGLQTSFLADLAAAGYPRETIDVVLCTHLHVDHVGWNTMLSGGRWIPTFPNARYLIGRAEYDYWLQQEAGSERPELSPFHDSVKPVCEAGLVDLVETDHQVCPEVCLEPTLGHTPGHVSVRIRSQGEEALITGDFTHHPCQLAHPEWASVFDHDMQASTATRRRVFGELAGAQVLLIGTHYAAPTAGRIVRDGEVYRFVC